MKVCCVDESGNVVRDPRPGMIGFSMGSPRPSETQSREWVWHGSTMRFCDG